MKAIIKHAKASSILHEGKFYDTNKEIELSFSDAMRMTRAGNISVSFDKADHDPELWKKDKFVNFFGDITASGFGNVSYNLIKFSDVQHAQMGLTFGKMEQKVLNAISRPMNQNGAMVWHDQPREQWLYSPFKKNIAIVPFETTRVPPSWVGKLNLFDALLVPCEQNIGMFRDSGVTIPIFLIHWGVDKNNFFPLERPERDIFTFGHMGALSIRKGTDILVEAFSEAFPKQKDVRLHCKTSQNGFPFATKDPRVKVDFFEWTPKELRDDFYKKIDCFVFPTRGEGAGLPPIEAAATGVPVIVTNWSGPCDYINDEMGWKLDYKMVPAKVFTDTIYREDCGDWAEPSKEHLIYLMRYAYEHRDEVKAKGKTAAEYITREWLWEDRIKEYEKALEQIL